MRIAQDDARPHADQLVHEEQSRLEQLLEYEQQPFALRRDDDRDGHEVRRKRGPRSVLELRDVAAEIGTDAPLLAGVDDQLVALEPRPHAEPLEREYGRAQIVAADAVDRNRAAGDGRQSDERPDLDVVRPHGMRRRLERAATFDRQGIAADAVDGGPECYEKARQVLHVWLGGGVAQHRGSARSRRRHQRVLGAGDARLVEKDIGALELALELVHVTDADLRAEALERQEM